MAGAAGDYRVAVLLPCRNEEAAIGGGVRAFREACPAPASTSTTTHPPTAPPRQPRPPEQSCAPRTCPARATSCAACSPTSRPTSTSSPTATAPTTRRRARAGRAARLRQPRHGRGRPHRRGRTGVEARPPARQRAAGPARRRLVRRTLHRRQLGLPRAVERLVKSFPAASRRFEIEPELRRTAPTCACPAPSCRRATRNGFPAARATSAPTATAGGRCWRSASS